MTGDVNKNSNNVYVNSNGVEVMRVSSVLKVLAKDQLVLWANMLGFKKVDYKKELDRTASVGTMVHGFLEDYFMKSGDVTVDYDKYGVHGFQSKGEACNCIDSFFAWYESMGKDDDCKYKVISNEVTVVGEKFGGTIDVIARGIKDSSKVILVDYKTSSNFYLTQFIQLSAYAKLYEEVNGEGTVEGIMVLLMDKKKGAKAKAKFIDRDNLNPFMVCFDCLYNVAISTRYLDSVWDSMTENIV